MAMVEVVIDTKLFCPGGGMLRPVMAMATCGARGNGEAKVKMNERWVIWVATRSRLPALRARVPDWIVLGRKDGEHWRVTWSRQRKVVKKAFILNMNENMRAMLFAHWISVELPNKPVKQ